MPEACYHPVSLFHLGMSAISDITLNRRITWTAPCLPSSTSGLWVLWCHSPTLLDRHRLTWTAVIAIIYEVSISVMSLNATQNLISGARPLATVGPTLRGIPASNLFLATEHTEHGPQRPLAIKRNVA